MLPCFTFKCQHSFLIWGTTTVFCYFCGSTFRKRNWFPDLFSGRGLWTSQSRVQLEMPAWASPPWTRSVWLTLTWWWRWCKEKKRVMENEFILKVASMPSLHFERTFSFFTYLFILWIHNNDKYTRRKSSELVHRVGGSTESHSSSSRKGVCFNLCHWLMGLGGSQGCENQLLCNDE